ncbi:MAG: hypothetical protein R2850_01645 [Bacteroidia bacterium]
MDKKLPAFETDRIKIEDAADSTRIEISGKISGLQFALLTAWLIAWTISGIYVFSQLFTDLPSETKMFMFVWLAFWFYFEYKIGSAWIWRKFGREVLLLQKGKSQLRFEVSYGGKGEEFETSGMRDFQLLETKKGLFIKNYFSSFWVVGGESIGFLVSGKLKMFGRQLPEKDAEKLLKFVQTKVQRYRK